LQSDVHQHHVPSYDIYAVLQDAEIYYGSSKGDDSEARRFGYLPKSLYQAMDPEHRKLWMSIPAKTREMIITFRGPQPPSVSEDVHLPGTGLASRNARATNQADGERSVNVTESTIINAMRANSLRNQNPRNQLSRSPFEPARLMSKQNKSSTKLVSIVPSSEPTSESKLLSAANDECK
jgi:hypothetical protein